MDQQLRVDPRTLQVLRERAVTVHVAETRDAVKLYNDLVDDLPVR
jgi:hypothetical protein